MSRVLLIGAGGHARVVRFACEAAGGAVIVGVLSDAHPVGEDWYGLPVLGGDAELADAAGRSGADAFFVARGDNATRARITAAVRSAVPALDAATIIHPSAVVAPDVVVGAGTVIMAGAIVHPGSRLGEGVLVNTRASIDHDSVLGDFASVAPGAVLAGTVTVGTCSAIGIAAAVLHGRRVGDHTVIGAGSVVTRDIGDLVVAWGSPAKPVRARAATDRYL